MFKYGGPIKEGVMHGMQDGGRIGFQDGTKKKIFGVEIPGTGIALDPATGNPYDPKYIKEMMKKEKDKMTNAMSWMFPGMRAIKGAGWSYKAGAPAIKKLFQAPLSKSKDLTKYTGPVTRGSDKWFGNIFRPAYQGLKQNVKSGLAPLKDFKTAIGLGIPAGGYGLAKGYEAWKKRQGTDIPDPLDPPTTETTSRWDDTTPILTQSMRDKLAKSKQNERLQSYLDIMGYDRSKKTAMSDALIDASALVQDATTEAGSLKKADWGSLINRAIQTTSKRLDKPEQIREAVGLMMTKGEIEKDIAEGKGGPLDSQVKSLVKNLGMDVATATRVAKGLPKDLREQVTLDVGTMKQPLTHSTLTSSVKKWYPDAIVLLNQDEVDDKLGDQTAEEFITEEIKADPVGGKGIYIIGKEVVKVDGKGNTSTIYP